jgi:hypothetical protein
MACVEGDSSFGRQIVLSVLLLAAWGGVGWALESLSLYDTFDAPNISKNKWLGGEGASSLGLESTRAIQNGQLLLRSRSKGGTGSDTGVSSNFVFLSVPDPEAVTEMKATITLTSVNDLACSSNSMPTLSFGALIGSFFNTGTPSNGDQTNDVVAAIGISQDSTRQTAGKNPHVGFLVIQCTDSSCTSFNQIAAQGLGSIALGSSATVFMEWDQTNHQFIFQRDSNAAVNSSYGVLPDTSSPGLPFKNVEVNNNVASCMTGTPKPTTANMSALFNNICLNQSAVPGTPVSCP